MPNLPALLARDEYLIAGDAGGNIGTGPFQLNGFNNGVLSLAANDNCWQGRPFLDVVEIRVHRNIHDQWLDLSVGRADLVEVPAEQLRQAREQRLTVLQSPLATLLALTVANSGVLGNPDLRAAIALAVDRSALSNVVFQKQGEITASLLPSTLTGYSFLFSTERNLNKSHEKHGGLTPPPLMLAAESGSAMQLAAQHIALNLHDAGFYVQVVAAGVARSADLSLRSLPLEQNQPQAALEAMLRGAGVQAPVLEQTPAGLFRVEREFLETHTLIPLLYLPRAYAISGRVRDLRLSMDGTPLLADASLQDAP
jgi:MarR-like DNA-binding transcriptional regulator SgrR of sgrS sRNA